LVAAEVSYSQKSPAAQPVFMADVILLRLHNFKRWRRGDRTVVIGHGSG
jgi:hypothetical protein